MSLKPASDAKELAFAIGQARQRWGADGWAWHPACEVRGGESWCVVGTRDGAYEHQWTPRGVGRTFAEAFANADACG